MIMLSFNSSILGFHRNAQKYSLPVNLICKKSDCYQQNSVIFLLVLFSVYLFVFPFLDSVTLDSVKRRRSVTVKIGFFLKKVW